MNYMDAQVKRYSEMETGGYSTTLRELNGSCTAMKKVTDIYGGMYEMMDSVRYVIKKLHLK